MRIILDTDFIINTIKYKIDIDEALRKAINSNFQIYIIDKTLDELKKINNQDSKLALKLIEFKKYEIIKTKKDRIADELIKEIAEKADVVATQDKELKKDLNKKLIKTISIRQMKYLK